MTNQVHAQYALNLDQCVNLISVVGKERTVLAQGDMVCCFCMFLAPRTHRLPGICVFSRQFHESVCVQVPHESHCFSSFRKGGNSFFCLSCVLPVYL